jgi:hypothetical protein
VTRKPPYCHAGQAQSHFYGVGLGDHYMPLQRLTLYHMSCFAIGFPLLDMIEYPQAPFTVAKVPHIGYNRIRSGPSSTLRPRR